MKIYILMVVVGALILAALLIDKLSSDAVGMALGVVFGLLAMLPTAMLMAVGRRREPVERIVYRVVERPVYRIATMEPESEQPAAMWELRQAHELEINKMRWEAESAIVADRLAAQVQTQRQIAKRVQP